MATHCMTFEKSTVRPREEVQCQIVVRKPADNVDEKLVAIQRCDDTDYLCLNLLIELGHFGVGKIQSTSLLNLQL